MFLAIKQKFKPSKISCYTLLLSIEPLIIVDLYLIFLSFPIFLRNRFLKQFDQGGRMAHRGFKIPLLVFFSSLINIIGLTDAQNWLVCRLVVGQMVVHSTDVGDKIVSAWPVSGPIQVDFMQSFLTIFLSMPLQMLLILLVKLDIYEADECVNASIFATTFICTIHPCQSCLKCLGTLHKRHCV